MTKKYQITCTKKQLQIIANACELYGDAQNGNPLSIADHLPLAKMINRFALMTLLLFGVKLSEIMTLQWVQNHLSQLKNWSKLCQTMYLTILNPLTQKC